MTSYREEKHTPGPCPGCGQTMANTGAPIWEDYCRNDDCTWHRDEFRRFFAKAAGATTPKEASKAFAEWCEEGPRLAKAAGVYVAIKVTPAKATGASS